MGEMSFQKQLQKNHFQMCFMLFAYLCTTGFVICQNFFLFDTIDEECIFIRTCNDVS